MRLFRESMWPEGQLAGPLPARTDEEKLQTRLQSKQKLLSSIPGMSSHSQLHVLESIPGA